MFLFFFSPECDLFSFFTFSFASFSVPCYLLVNFLKNVVLYIPHLFLVGYSDLSQFSSQERDWRQSIDFTGTVHKRAVFLVVCGKTNRCLPSLREPCGEVGGLLQRKSYHLLCMGSEVFYFPACRVSSLADVFRKPVSNFLWLSNSWKTHVSLLGEKSVILGLGAPILALNSSILFSDMCGSSQNLNSYFSSLFWHVFLRQSRHTLYGPWFGSP